MADHDFIRLYYVVYLSWAPCTLPYILVSNWYKLMCSFYHQKQTILNKENWKIEQNTYHMNSYQLTRNHFISHVSYGVLYGTMLLVMCLWSACIEQADHTSLSDRDSPGFERRVPASRKGGVGTQYCPGYRSRPVRSEHITSSLMLPLQV